MWLMRRSARNPQHEEAAKSYTQAVTACLSLRIFPPITVIVASGPKLRHRLALVEDLLERADVNREVNGCWRINFGMYVSAPGCDRGHGGGRSGTWIKRSGQHPAMTISQMSIQNTTPSPQKRH